MLYLPRKKISVLKVLCLPSKEYIMRHPYGCFPDSALPHHHHHHHHYQQHQHQHQSWKSWEVASSSWKHASFWLRKNKAPQYVQWPYFWCRLLLVLRWQKSDRPDNIFVEPCSLQKKKLIARTRHSVDFRCSSALNAEKNIVDVSRRCMNSFKKHSFIKTIMFKARMTIDWMLDIRSVLSKQTMLSYLFYLD